MNLPFEYDRVAVGEFGGTTPTTTDFEHARVVILPVPLDRTTSYVAGTRNGPHEILVGLVAHGAVGRGDRRPTSTASASSRCRRWSFRSRRMDEVMREIRRVASEIVARGKFPFVLGGEHSITRAGRRRRSPRVTRACRCCRSTRTPTCATRYMGTPHNHACAMRRVLEYARDDAGRHPQPVARRSGGRPVAADDDLLRLQHAAGSELDRSRRRLARARRSTSRSTVDGLDPGDHAGRRHAGAGRACRGTRRWRCCARVDRIAARSSDAIWWSCARCPGNVAPNFLCAKLIYKILIYRFGREVGAKPFRRRTTGQLGPPSGLLQRFELAAGVAAERRFGEFFDDPVERLLRLGGLAGFAVGARRAASACRRPAAARPSAAPAPCRC